MGIIMTLNLLFWNARGICNKEVVLKDMMDKEEVRYGGVSESKTYQDNTSLSDRRWRWDPGKEEPPSITSTTVHRGMGAFIDTTKCKGSLISVGVYTMWHRIEIGGVAEGSALVVGTGYFPGAQDTKAHVEANKELLDALILYRRQGHHVVFGGDLNAHMGIGGTDVDAAGRLLRDTVDRAGMLVVNEMPGIGDQGPTRVQVRSDGTQTSVIDFVMISPSLSSHVGSMSISQEQLGSDHRPMVLRLKDLHVLPPTVPTIREVWNIRNIPSPPQCWSWVDACQARFGAWLGETDGAIRALDAVEADSERIADILEWSFQKALDEVATSQLGTRRAGQRATPNTDKAMELLINQKKVSERIMMLVCAEPCSSETARVNARRQFLKLSRAVTAHAARRREMNELLMFRDIEDHQNNSKLFWGKYKVLRGASKAGKAPPPVVMDEEGCTQTDPTSVLRAWRDFSAQIASSDLSGTHEEGIYDDDYKRDVERRLDMLKLFKDHQQEIDHPITSKEVFRAVRKLTLGKAPGEDGILTDIIKTAADAVNNSKLRGDNTVISAITLLFNFILDREVWPQRWSTGVIFPLHKGGSRLDPGNYRPITLLSVMGKLFGIVIDWRLTKFAERTGMFSDEQGGFRPHRGTPDQILILRETLVSRKERGLPTYTTFIDVKKAYDTVWREQAYVRIHEGGIKGKLWRQLQAMHGGLTRRVRHPLGPSDPFPVERGVAQGAVESPWVYAAFIDGIAQALHAAGLGIIEAAAGSRSSCTRTT